MSTDKQISFYNSLLDQIVRITPSGEFSSETLTVAREAFPARTVADASDAIARAQRTVARLKDAAPVATAPVAAIRPNVPDGHYALVVEGVVKFYSVNTPTEGKWEGFTFVDAQASDEHFPIKNTAARNTILAAIAADPLAAMKLYGIELGKCGHCGRTLTSDWRKVGIGPVCSKRMGF